MGHQDGSLETVAGWRAASGGGRSWGKRGAGAGSNKEAAPSAGQLQAGAGRTREPCEPHSAPPILHRNGGVGPSLPNGAWRGGAGDDVMSISGPPGSAEVLLPGPLFPASRAGFSKPATHP